jgi:ABC-type Na+ efflux pump permease subunit
MKKLIGILVVLLLIGVAAVFVLSKTAGKIIRKGVVTLGPEIAQVNIELESVDISFIGMIRGHR